jgi:hypothetical protein
MENSFSILVAILLVRFVALEATYQRAIRLGLAWRFPVGMTLRIILGVGLPLCLYVCYETYLLANQTGEWWLLPICLSFATLFVFCDPGDIRTSARGIELVRWLGLKRTSIPWEGAAARYTPLLREVLVVGADGATITHSQYHVGQDQFLFELRRHGVYVQ